MQPQPIPLSTSRTDRYTERYRSTVVSIWQRLPVWLRRRIVRLTQSTFTIGVSGIVLDDRNRILLLRHRLRESADWELPGGFIRRGEDLQAALRRELKEETGYSVRVISRPAIAMPRASHLDVSFVARIVGGSLNVDPGEVLEARFFAPEELPAELKPDQQRELGQALAERP